MQRMGIFEGTPTCRWCGEQEETGEHLLFDCDALAQVRFTVFGFLSKDGNILMTGYILKYCRLIDLLAKQE